MEKQLLNCKKCSCWCTKCRVSEMFLIPKVQWQLKVVCAHLAMFEFHQIYIIASNLLKNIDLPTGIKVCCLDSLVTTYSQIQPRV